MKHQKTDQIAIDSNREEELSVCKEGLHYSNDSDKISSRMDIISLKELMANENTIEMDRTFVNSSDMDNSFMSDTVNSTFQFGHNSDSFKSRTSCANNAKSSYRKRILGKNKPSRRSKSVKRYLLLIVLLLLLMLLSLLFLRWNIMPELSKRKFSTESQNKQCAKFGSTKEQEITNRPTPENSLKDEVGSECILDSTSDEIEKRVDEDPPKENYIESEYEDIPEQVVVDEKEIVSSEDKSAELEQTYDFESSEEAYSNEVNELESNELESHELSKEHEVTVGVEYHTKDKEHDNIFESVKIDESTNEMKEKEDIRASIHKETVNNSVVSNNVAIENQVIELMRGLKKNKTKVSKIKTKHLQSNQASEMPIKTRKTKSEWKAHSSNFKGFRFIKSKESILNVIAETSAKKVSDIQQEHNSSSNKKDTNENNGISDIQQDHDDASNKISDIQQDHNDSSNKEATNENLKSFKFMSDSSGNTTESGSKRNDKTNGVVGKDKIKCKIKNKTKGPSRIKIKRTDLEVLHVEMSEKIADKSKISVCCCKNDLISNEDAIQINENPHCSELSEENTQSIENAILSAESTESESNEDSSSVKSLNLNDVYREPAFTTDTDNSGHTNPK
ncbi:hypothetical protein ENBRE01_1633, partial [Enteropsectra breve]